MKAVYLDQNKWIDLARVYHDKAADPALRPVLDAALAASQNGSAAFPLSAVHYIETWKNREPQRRTRLDEFMWNLSGAGQSPPATPTFFPMSLKRRWPRASPRSYRVRSPS
jgi:hypothetical protein